MVGTMAFHPFTFSSEIKKHTMSLTKLVSLSPTKHRCVYLTQSKSIVRRRWCLHTGSLLGGIGRESEWNGYAEIPAIHALNAAAAP